MFGISFYELLIVLCLGIILIGPKDIPNVVYSFVKFIRKIKLILGDFNKSVELFMTEAELNDLSKNIHIDEKEFIDKDLFNFDDKKD